MLLGGAGVSFESEEAFEGFLGTSTTYEERFLAFGRLLIAGRAKIHA
jgi:hypothetical protein